MIEHFIDHRGTLLRRDVVRAGVDDRLITRAHRDGLIIRVHHGGYCRFDIWEAADRAERHRIRSHIVRRLYGDDVARSHATALLELGGPDWGLDLTKIHLTHLGGVGERTQSGIVHHRGVLLADDVTRRDGSWVTAYARTALDTAATAARNPAVVVLDWVQSSGHATREELTLGIERMKEWPGTIGLHHKLRLSSGLAESMMETLAALFMRDHGIPMFEPQWSIHHPSGRLAGRVDGVWHRFRKMLEVDSVRKYLKHRRPGESIEQCVIREKRREDLLRRLTGYGMIRLMKADFDRGEETAEMLRRELEPPAA